MDEHKIPQDEQEEYSFLQEVIKDEAGSRAKIKKSILRTAGYGILFGVIASFSFCALKPWFTDRFMSNPRQVTIPQDDEEEESKEEESENDSEQVETLGYKQMLQSLNKTAAETGKSVVEVTGLTGAENWEEESDRNKQSVSGVIIADNGQELLVLSKVVPVKNAKQIQITFNGGDRYDAVEKKRDNNLELCIYAVKRDEITDKTWQKIQTAKLGSSNLAAEGDIVIVLGKPFGYADTVSYGMIASNGAHYRENADGAHSLIYTDVAGSKDGSGIITNIKGEIIGIIDQKNVKEGEEQIIGYSISDIKDVVELLSNGESVPYVGICGMDVTEAMESRGIPYGVYVREVEPDSPAMEAGIQSGDIITQIDGVESTNYTVYHDMLMKEKQGTQIKFKGKRQGAGEEYVDIDFNITIGTKQ